MKKNFLPRVLQRLNSRLTQSHSKSTQAGGQILKPRNGRRNVATASAYKNDTANDTAQPKFSSSQHQVARNSSGVEVVELP